MWAFDILNTWQSTEELLGLQNTQEILSTTLNKESKIKFIENKLIDKSFMSKSLKQDLNDLNNLTGFVRIRARNSFLKKIDKVFKEEIERLLNGEAESEKPQEIEKSVNKSTSVINQSATGSASNWFNTSTVNKLSTNTEKKEIEMPKNAISIKDLELLVTYLEFKGQKKSEVYILLKNDIIKTVNASPQILAKKIYIDFIKTYIFDNIINNIFTISKNNEAYKKNYKKIKQMTNSILHAFQNELAGSNVKSISILTENFVKMDDQRNKISDLQWLSFDQLLNKDLLNIKFLSVRSDLKKAITEFRKNSEKTDKKDVADFLTDENIEKLYEEINETEELFKELKLQLLYIHNYVNEKGVDNINSFEKKLLSNELKGIIWMMYFINGLNYNIWEEVVNNSFTWWAISESLESGIPEWILVGSGVAWLLVSKFISKSMSRKAFFKIINSDQVKKVEWDGGDLKNKAWKIDKLKSIFSSKNTLNKLGLKEISALISDMTEENNDWNKVLKDEYEKLEWVYNRLKKIRDLKYIVWNLEDSNWKRVFKWVSFKNDIVFLSDKAFSREILFEMYNLKPELSIKGTANTMVSWTVKYLWLWVWESIADIYWNRPFLRLGKNTEYFWKIKAIDIVNNFINKYKSVVNVSSDLKLLRNEWNIDQSKRVQIKDTVNNIKERLVNKNIILSEHLVELFHYKDELDKEGKRVQVQKMLDSEKFWKKIRMLEMAWESTDVYKNTDGLIEKRLQKITVLLTFLKDTLSTFWVWNEKSFKNIWRNEITELVKTADDEFVRVNNSLMSDDWIIDKKKVQKYIVQKLNSELGLELDQEKLSKDYFERLRKWGTTEKLNEIKVLRTNVITENAKLDSLKFDYTVIDSIKTEDELKKMQDIISSIESVNKEKSGLWEFSDIIDKILEKNKTEIESSINNSESFKIDSRILEMLWKEWEISNIRQIIEYIKGFEWEDWYSDNVKSSIVKELRTWLEAVDPLNNKITAIFNKLKELKEMPDVTKKIWKEIMIDEEKTDNKRKKLVDKIKKLLDTKNVETIESINKWTQIELIYERAMLQADLDWDIELSDRLFDDYNSIDIENTEINTLEESVKSKYSKIGDIKDIEVLEQEKKLIMIDLETKGLIKKDWNGYKILKKIELKAELQRINKVNFIGQIGRAIKTWG